MTRKGKIARLPRNIRDQLNQRLDDGEIQAKLVDWLNALPKVKAVLRADFDGQPITEQNLSEWKQGGFRDWQFDREAAELAARLHASADAVNQGGKTRLSDLLAQRLAARCMFALDALCRSSEAGELARHPEQSEGSRSLRQSNEDGEETMKRLRELCRDIAALRRGDHSAERLKLERERLDLEREKVRQLRADECRAWALEHRDEIGKALGMPPSRLVVYGEPTPWELDPSNPDQPIAWFPNYPPAAPAPGKPSDQVRPNPTSAASVPSAAPAPQVILNAAKDLAASDPIRPNPSSGVSSPSRDGRKGAVLPVPGKPGSGSASGSASESLRSDVSPRIQPNPSEGVFWNNGP